jgi:hypothetical protein
MAKKKENIPEFIEKLIERIDALKKEAEAKGMKPNDMYHIQCDLYVKDDKTIPNMNTILFDFPKPKKF